MKNINFAKLCISKISIITYWISGDGKLYELGKDCYHEHDRYLKPTQNTEIENVIDVQSSRYFSIAFEKPFRYQHALMHRVSGEQVDIFVPTILW